MSPEKQNAALAQIAGWGKEDAERGYSLGQFSENVPNYVQDLNAIREIEDMLRIGMDRCNKTLRKYRNELAKIVGCSWYQSAEMICASAEQRAEALLKTLNLWEK